MLGGSGVPWGVQQSSGIRPGAPQTIVLRALDLPGYSLIAMHQVLLIMSFRDQAESTAMILYTSSIFHSGLVQRMVGSHGLSYRAETTICMQSASIQC